MRESTSRVQLRPDPDQPETMVGVSIEDLSGDLDPAGGGDFRLTVPNSASRAAGPGTETTPGATGVDDGSEDVVIDLRDPRVAGGLAEALDQLVSLSERAGAAEARAEIARHERMAATGQLRRLSTDLEQEQAERHRLEVDLARAETELDLRDEQLGQAKAEIQRGREQLRAAVATAEREVDSLRDELARAQRMVHILETLVSRRKRRTFERLTGDDQQS